MDLTCSIRKFSNGSDQSFKSKLKVVDSGRISYVTRIDFHFGPILFEFYALLYNVHSVHVLAQCFEYVLYSVNHLDIRNHVCLNFTGA